MKAKVISNKICPLIAGKSNNVRKLGLEPKEPEYHVVRCFHIVSREKRKLSLIQHEIDTLGFDYIVTEKDVENFDYIQIEK